MLDIFVGYFANPLSWVFLAIFLFVGLLIGIFIRPWMGNQVQKFIPADHRFMDLAIDEETSISVTCKKTKGMPAQRFFKLHPGFTGVVGRFLKKPITRYLGIEGTAYTWQIENNKWKKLGTLADSVRAVWGEDFWTTVPTNKREQLEDSRIQVTVGLDEAPLTPAGMRSISEEDIKQEEDRRAAQVFWEEHKSQTRGFYINMILAGGTGFAICAVLVLLGLIKMPTPAPAQVQQAAATAAEMIGTGIRGLMK